jgi:hypothetical protein
MSKQVNWYASDSRALASAISQALAEYDLNDLSEMGLTNVIAQVVAEYIGPIEE